MSLDFAAAVAFFGQEGEIILEAMKESGNFDEKVETFYDFFFNALLSLRKEGKKITKKRASGYFEEIKKFTEDIESENPFVAFGGAFASPLFEEESLREIADARRLRIGFSVLEGLHPCPRCKAPPAKTTAVEKQTRRADEAIPLINLCLACNYRWQVG